MVAEIPSDLIGKHRAALACAIGPNLNRLIEATPEFASINVDDPAAAAVTLDTVLDKRSLAELLVALIKIVLWELVRSFFGSGGVFS